MAGDVDYDQCLETSPAHEVFKRHQQNQDYFFSVQ